MSLKTCTRDAMECMKRRGAETAFPKFRFMEMCCERSEWEMKHHRLVSRAFLLLAKGRNKKYLNFVDWWSVVQAEFN